MPEVVGVPVDKIKYLYDTVTSIEEDVKRIVEMVKDVPGAGLEDKIHLLVTCYELNCGRNNSYLES